MKFTIPFSPVTKKNSQQICINRKTGKRFISQSEQYKAYERASCLALNGSYRKNIDFPINLAATFFMPTQRRVDLVNLIEALQDVLVKAGVLADDNSSIVVSTDGSRVALDRRNPRTEVEITPL